MVLVVLSLVSLQQMKYGQLFWKIYRNPQSGLSFKYPPEWEISEAISEPVSQIPRMVLSLQLRYKDQGEIVVFIQEHVVSVDTLYEDDYDKLVAKGYNPKKEITEINGNRVIKTETDTGYKELVFEKRSNNGFIQYYFSVSPFSNLTQSQVKQFRATTESILSSIRLF